MTKIQQLHHDEMMEACRAEFEQLWDSQLAPMMVDLDLKVNNTFAVRHLCWTTFLYEKHLLK